MAKSIVCLQSLTKEQEEAIRKAAPGYTYVHSDAKQPDLDALAEAEIVIGWAKESPIACFAKARRSAGCRLGPRASRSCRLTGWNNGELC